MPETSSANKLLSRITALHRSLSVGDDGSSDPPSALERDLMLGYLREFYEIYAAAATDSGSAVRTPTPRPQRTAVAQSTNRYDIPAGPAAPEPMSQQEHPTERPEPDVRRPPVSSPPIAPATAPSVPSVPVPPPPPPPVGDVRTAVVEPSYTTPAPNPPQPAPAPNTSPEIEKLFASDEAGDLAARLGQQPIRDLTRAMTINNRVLFTKALFGGDNDAMNRVLNQLNTLGSMDAAKPVLIDLAARRHWTEEERRDTAREFINLVRRRYA